MDLREIDRKVAEHVMGLKPPYSYVRPKMSFARPSKHIGEEEVMTIPRYSSDIKAAWEVVEKLIELTPQVQKTHGDWCATLYKGRNQTVQHFRASATTAPLAICLAALRAHGIDVEKKDPPAREP